MEVVFKYDEETETYYTQVKSWQISFWLNDEDEDDEELFTWTIEITEDGYRQLSWDSLSLIDGLKQAIKTCLNKTGRDIF